MGRPGAAKRLKKAEKAKVKLKGHTTKFLPKGKNVTNTVFKVRKIVLQEQLKAADTSQPLSQKKLNIKELLTRLNHYSSAQRLEALSGLKDLLNQLTAEQLTSYLSSLLDNLLRCALDAEHDVRKNSAQLLSLLLNMIKEAQLTPFSEGLSSYLSCAMTHIQPRVQEDSFLFLDAIFHFAPSIMASSAYRLLPCVLNMISKINNEKKTNRTLSVNMGNRFTSVEWRAKVFGYLHALLTVSLNDHHCKTNKEGRSFKETVKTLSVDLDSSKKIRFPIYNPQYLLTPDLTSIFYNRSIQIGSDKLLNSTAMLRRFTDSLFPLLIDSWVEVSPYSSQQSKKSLGDSGLQAESAIILHWVLEITRLLWEHLCNCDSQSSSSELSTWFKRKYVDGLHRFLAIGFPYSASAVMELDTEKEQSQGRGRKRSKAVKDQIQYESLLQLVCPQTTKVKANSHPSYAVMRCIPQNLELCRIFTTMVNPSSSLKKQIINFLASCLESWGSNHGPWLDHLDRAVQSVLQHGKLWSDSIELLLSALVNRCHMSSKKPSAVHKAIVRKINSTLGNIVLQPQSQYLLKYDCLSTWVSQLPATFYKEEISQNTVLILNRLACQRNDIFLRGLQSAMPNFISSLKGIEISGEDISKTECDLASLFYWVSEWTEEILESLSRQLPHCSPTLRNKILQVLSLKKNSVISFRDASWWNSNLQS